MSEEPTVPTAATGQPFDGGMLGRYVLLRELGRGSMGTVYAAFDPDLDRPVAVKVVAGDGHTLAPYLLGEARTLAALSHPHIVPVFDIGQASGRLYIVMELVDGVSLADWLAERPRTTREIVRAWCAAGRGLAAAHASGVVHRDFKASNVLIGSDGHVRVADFGLARAPDDGGPVEGTRDYMAPEVVAHGAATEAVDQYAFCTSLGRALDDRRIGRALRKIIERGTANDPAARWPSMAAVVDALEAVLRAPRRRAIAAVVAVVACAGGTGTWLFAGSRREACDPDGVVAREIPRTLRDRLDVALRDGSPKLVQRVDRLLDDDVRAWTRAFEARCASVDQARCLETRLSALALSLDDAIVENGKELLDLPIELALWPNDLASCASETRDQSREYRHAMARAIALARQGRSKEARAAVDAAIAAARDPVAVVRAKYRRLVIDDDPDVAQFATLYADAQATGDRELAGDVAIAAAQTCRSLPTWSCAKDWTERAAETLGKLPTGRGALLRANLTGERGELALLDGNPEAASALFADEIRQLTAIYGGDNFELISGLTSLSSAQRQLKHYADAVESSRRADAIVVRWLGEDHPYRAIALIDLGGAQIKTGDRRGAIASLQRALALRIAVEGDTSPRLGTIYNNLAAAYKEDGQLGHALEMIDRAVACYAKAPSGERANEVFTLHNAAMLAGMLARPDARARIDAAIVAATGRLPADHPQWAALILTRAMIELRTGDDAAAGKDLDDAFARFSRAGERTRGEQAVTMGYRALLELREHHLAAAERTYETASRLGVALGEGTARRIWLDELAVELAIARGDPHAARDRLAKTSAVIANLREASDPRTFARHHLLAALVDPAAAGAEHARAAAILEAADIPAGSVDCAVCK